MPGRFNFKTFYMRYGDGAQVFAGASSHLRGRPASSARLDALARTALRRARLLGFWDWAQISVVRAFLGLA